VLADGLEIGIVVALMKEENLTAHVIYPMKPQTITAQGVEKSA
jgi:hypothetical protein